MTVAGEVEDRVKFDPVGRYPRLSVPRIPETHSRDRHRSRETEPGRSGDGPAIAHEGLAGRCDLVPLEERGATSWWLGSVTRRFASRFKR
jgi:hypothetical protein